MPNADYEICVDWDNNGNYTGTYDDISADVLIMNDTALVWSRGRNKQVGTSEAGTFQFSTKNDDGKYSPEKVSGVLYGKLLPGRPVRLRATYDATTYDLWHGFITRITPYPWHDKKTCYFYCVDGIQWLSMAKVSMGSITAIGTGVQSDGKIADVDTSASAGAHQRKIARKSNGDLWCVYYKSDGANSQIYCSYSTDNGATWTEEAVTAEAASQGSPTIAIDSDDIVHVVWTGFGHGANPGNSNLRHRQKTAGGWQAAEAITDEAANQADPSIAVDGSDVLHCVWIGLGWGVNPGVSNIRYASYGGSWTASEAVSDSASDQDNPVALAVDKDNNVHVAWDGLGWGVFVGKDNIQYRKRTSGSWGSQESVTDVDDPQGVPGLATDSSGHVHCVWYGWGWGTNTSKFNIQYRKRTTAWQTQEAITDVAFDQYNPSVSVDGDNNPYVAWRGKGWGSNTTKLNIQYRNRVGSWQTQVAVTDLAWDQYGPCLLWAYWPTDSDNIRFNVARSGCFILYNGQDAVGYRADYYSSSDLTFNEALDWESMTESEMINALLDAAGWPISKRIIDSTNPKRFKYWSEGQSVLVGIQTVELFTGSMFYLDRAGNAKWESMAYRSKNSGTPVVSFDNTMHDLSYNKDGKDIFNHIMVRVKPPQVPQTDPDDPDVQVEREWKRYPYRFISSPGWDGVDRYQDFWAVTNEDEFAASWGTPTVKARYFASDTPAYPDITIISQSRTQCTIRVTNNTDEDIVVEFISITYVPLVEDDPIDDAPPDGGWAEGRELVEVEDTVSQAAYTYHLKKTKEITVPFPMPYEDALALAQYYLNYFKDPVPDISQVVKNDTAANLVAILDTVISDRITSKLSNFDLDADFFVNQESHRVTEGGLWHEVKWILEKAASQREIFVWDTSVFDSGAIWAPW